MNKQRTNSTKRRRRAPSDNDRSSFSQILKSSAIGCAVSLAIVTALLIAAAAICYASEDPTSLTVPAGAIILAVSSLFGGMISAKINKAKALLCGIGNGILMNLFSLFLGIFTPHGQNDFSFPISLILRTAVVLCSILGSLIAANTGKSVRRGRR